MFTIQEKIKMFRVLKAVRAKWDGMMENGDRLGRYVEEARFIRKRLENIESPLAEIAFDLECKLSFLEGERARNGGLNGIEATKADAYYNMAVALVATETDEKTAHDFKMGKF